MEKWRKMMQMDVRSLYKYWGVLKCEASDPSSVADKKYMVKSKTKS